jgi:uridine kinase
MNRSQTLAWLAKRIASIQRAYTVRVAIDGVDGAGKTTLADELVAPLKAGGRAVIRASVDGFHNPRAIRYRLGQESPEGYYQNSFNYPALTRELLEPLGPGGHGEFRTAVFDHIRDASANEPLSKAPKGAILLFDGVFLLRPELRRYWELTVFVEVSLETGVSRAIARDQGQMETSELRRRYRRRYVPGQEIYLRRCKPQGIADVVFDNEVIAEPRILQPRNPDPGGEPHSA